MADSRDVAVNFGKRHADVLRDLDVIRHNANLRHVENQGFSEASTPHPTIAGRADRSFVMTRQGFTLLAMGWTGPKAMAFKVKYIQAFDAMEAALHEGVVGEITGDVRKVIGGIVKAIVHSEIVIAVAALKEELVSSIPAMVDAAVMANRFGITRGFVTAGEICDMAKVPPKGRRSLVCKVSYAVRRHCMRIGVATREACLGATSACVFPLATAKEWLADAGHDLIREHEAKRAGQGVLKLVQPAPKKGDGPSKGA